MLKKVLTKISKVSLPFLPIPILILLVTGGSELNQMQTGMLIGLIINNAFVLIAIKKEHKITPSKPHGLYGHPTQYLAILFAILLWVISTSWIYILAGILLVVYIFWLLD